MMKKIIFMIMALAFIGIIPAKAQQPEKDKAFFKEYEPGFYQNFILKDVRQVEEKIEKKEKEKRFMMDHSSLDLPNKAKPYTTYWANPTESQGNAGSCWCYSTTSFLESEIYRLYEKKVEISEIYTVYWEYVEKAKRFVKERGNSKFSQGSEANAVTRMMKMYGAVPQEVYTGLKDGRKYHSHDQMMKEMKGFLKKVEDNNMWNEKFVIATIKDIMNKYIGEPPAKFTFEGKEYTPKQFLNDYLKLNPNDYIEVLSYKQEPYWQQVEYKVPDNWWHSKEYYNIPLKAFMETLKKGIRDGYTVSIGGDVSEAGFSRETNCALVPSFDIPAEYINENARQFRFSNKSTTDDHGMHLIGYYEKDGEDWYLIKDSSSGSRNIDQDSPEFGHYFFHEDYVKLKMMGYTIHKDAFKDLMKKFK